MRVVFNSRKWHRFVNSAGLRPASIDIENALAIGRCTKIIIKRDDV